jgi:hypothetical protein
LTRHERVITADMPGELGLAPRMMVRVEGTFTDFDQTYWIDRVERRLSLANGFTQTVHARNASETNQSTSPADKVISVWTDS